MTHTYIHPWFLFSSACSFYYQICTIVVMMSQMHLHPSCPHTSGLIHSFVDYFSPSHQHLIRCSQISSEFMILSELNPRVNETHHTSETLPYALRGSIVVTASANVFTIKNSSRWDSSMRASHENTLLGF